MHMQEKEENYMHMRTCCTYIEHSAHNYCHCHSNYRLAGILENDYVLQASSTILPITAYTPTLHKSYYNFYSFLLLIIYNNLTHLAGCRKQG